MGKFLLYSFLHLCMYVWLTREISLDMRSSLCLVRNGVLIPDMSIFPIRRDEAICFGLGKSFVDSWPPECEADIPIGLFMNSHLITQEWLNERLAREPIILKIDGQIILITELTVQEFFNLELEIFCRANVLKTAASSNSKKKDIAYETTFRGRITTLYQRFLAGQPLTNKDFCQDALLKEEGLIVRTMAHLMQISLANHDNRQLIIRTWPLTEIKRVRGTVSDPGKGAFAKHLLSSSMLSYRISEPIAKEVTRRLTSPRCADEVVYHKNVCQEVNHPIPQKPKEFVPSLTRTVHGVPLSGIRKGLIV